MKTNLLTYLPNFTLDAVQHCIDDDDENHFSSTTTIKVS